MALGTLTIDIAANVAGLESDLGKAQRIFDKNARDFERTAKSIAKVTAGISAAVAVGFAAMVKNSIDVADALQDVSEASGITVEKLSALKLAADIEEISLDQLSTSFNKFSKAVDSAKDGAGASADVFSALGIEITNTDGSLKNNYVLLEEVAEALSKMENGAEKTAAAQALFGKSGTALIPILNGGRKGLQDFSTEAERMGRIISSKTAQDAGRFNDTLTRLRLSISGLSNVVAGEVTDDLADMVEILSDPQTQSGIAAVASGLVVIGAKAAEAAAALGNLTRYLADSVARALNGIDLSVLVDVEDEITRIKGLIENPITARLNPLLPTRLAFKNKDELIAEMELLVKKRDELINSGTPSLIKPSSDASVSLPVSISTDMSKVQADIEKMLNSNLELYDQSIEKQKQLSDSYKGQLDSYHRQIALAGEVTEVERVRYEFTHGALVGISEQQKILLDSEAKRIDIINEATKAKEKQLEIERQLTSDLDGVRQSLLTQEQAITREAERRAKVLMDAHRAKKIQDEEFESAMRRNGELAKRELDEIAKKNSEIAEITKELYRGVQNSIADAIVTGIKGGGENALEAFRDLLIRMAAEAAAADVTRWIFGSGQNGSTGGSGTGSNTVGIISTVASWFGGGRAVGGPVQAGKMYEVGENNNPELFYAGGRQYMIPGNNGSVVPGGAGGGAAVVINMDMRGATNSREMRESAGALARKVSGAVAAAQRYN